MKVQLKILLFISIIFISKCLAQEVFIKKIIDTNLFELNNGQKVTIYGIHVPSLNDTNESYKNLAKEIYEWEQETIANKIFNVKYIDGEGDIKPIKLFKKLADTEINIASWFLSKGYAFLKNDNNDFSYLAQYEREAHKNKLGIWQEVSNKEIVDNTMKEKIYVYTKQYERPYLYLIPLSLASFVFAWDSFASVSDIQKNIDLFTKLKLDASDLKASKTRKKILGIASLAAGVFTAIMSFKEVEIKTDASSITMSYKF